MLRTDYAYQDSIRRDFRNKVTAVIAVGLLGLVLTAAIDENGFLLTGEGQSGSASLHSSSAETGLAPR